MGLKLSETLKGPNLLIEAAQVVAAFFLFAAYIPIALAGCAGSFGWNALRDGWYAVDYFFNFDPSDE